MALLNGHAESDVGLLVDSLRSTFRSGLTRDVEWRKQQLQNMLRMLVEREQDFYDALAKDLGINLTQSVLQVLDLKPKLDFMLKNLSSWVSSKKVGTPSLLLPAQSEIIQEPYGVVLVLGPWNFPIALSLEPVMGAIAAGNAVLLKPSEISPNTAALLERTVHQYMDQSAVRVVQGGPELGAKLLELKWDKIFFTGGTEIGRKVAIAAAKHLTPVTLELGGRNPVYLDESIDLKMASERLICGMNYNTGQLCLKPEYILVHRSMATSLVNALKQTIWEFYGEDPSQSADLGCMVNDRHFDRLMGLITDPGVAKSLVHGGSGNKDKRFISPTLFLDVPWDAPLMQQETFGPVMCIQTVDSVEQAIDIINDRPKPLALYIFSTKKPVIDKILAETSSGGVCVNDTVSHVANPNLPFGGVGESGMGTYHGKYTFDCFSHEKPLMRKDYKKQNKLLMPPTTVSSGRMLRAYLLGDMWGFFMYLFGFRK